MDKTASLTRNQTLVLDILRQTNTPMSAYTILDSIRDQGVRAPLQVYRALEKLQQNGLIHRLESLNAFIACAHPHCHEHAFTAFVICDQCESVSEFNDTSIADDIARKMASLDFKAQNTTLEIRGLCAKCRNQAQ